MAAIFLFLGLLMPTITGLSVALMHKYISYEWLFRWKEVNITIDVSSFY